jgi:hypothetical protein
MRGFLLVEAMVGFFLIFLSAVTILNLLQFTDLGYSEAAQATMALELAQQVLENVEAGSVGHAVGTQVLATHSLVVGRNPIVFTPTLVVTSASPVVLARAQVSWSENGRKHIIELKTYVAP